MGQMIQVAQKIVNRDVNKCLVVNEELASLDDLAEFRNGFEFFVEQLHFIEIQFDM
ncbi:hypothetical protein OCE25_27150 [Bacillus cereus]|nr:hypothetical protein [Bacillus cereus]